MDQKVEGKISKIEAFSDADPSITMDVSTKSEGGSRSSPNSTSNDRVLPKGRKWITIVSTLVICAVMACIAVSTLFVSKYRHQDQRRKAHSSIGPANTQHSSFGLNFAREYPKLDTERSTQACRNAWNSLTAVPCHEKIWNRSWDFGHYDPLEFELDRFLPLICREECTDALSEAKSMISNSCSAHDHFEIHRYKGRFNTTLLEPNPVAVIDVLLARQTHDCQTSPVGDAERGYCMTDLQERWSVLNGLMVEPLHGIDEFLLKTNQYRTEPAEQMLGMIGGSDWVFEYNYMREERSFGPRRGETTCSYCTLDWLGRKLKSWKPDLIYYKNGSPMELPVYLERISKAGRRCAGENFTTLWAEAIGQYEDQGLLDREGKWLRQPSGNKLYLFQHGPSAGDSPSPEIRDYLEEMGDWQSSHPYLSEKESEELHHVASCLQGLHEETLSMTCYPFLSIEDLASNILDTPEHLRSSCTNDCQVSIQRLKVMTIKTWPELVYHQKHYRTQESEIPFSLYEWGEMIFSNTGYLASTEKACGWRQKEPTCGEVFTQFNRPSWITGLDIDAHEFQQAVRVAVKALPPAIPTTASMVDSMANSEEPTNDEQEMFRKQKAGIEYSVCSPCVWNQFAGAEYWPKNLASLSGDKETHQWMHTLRMLSDACAARGVEFEKSELTKVNTAAFERVARRIVRESYQHCMADRSKPGGVFKKFDHKKQSPAINLRPKAAVEEA